MPKANVFNMAGQQVGEIELSEAIGQETNQTGHGGDQPSKGAGSPPVSPGAFGQVGTGVVLELRLCPDGIKGGE